MTETTEQQEMGVQKFCLVSEQRRQSESVQAKENDRDSNPCSIPMAVPPVSQYLQKILWLL